MSVHSKGHSLSLTYGLLTILEARISSKGASLNNVISSRVSLCNFRQASSPPKNQHQSVSRSLILPFGFDLYSIN
ncbi:hypothetical protein L2E82_24611 [Cichorium intybus]|uniref:Uncharacterized protein n=1 Tax=Cichorium intybus TaxID=13427 RepID=A0ACB9E287_CICIN|nr:hypothetical protein L2E82_24611 [Cichorium intybus]